MNKHKQLNSTEIESMSLDMLRKALAATLIDNEEQSKLIRQLRYKIARLEKRNEQLLRDLAGDF